MKLHSKFVWERFVTAIKIDRIPLFDVRCSLVSFPIRLAVFLASGGARVILAGLDSLPFSDFDINLTFYQKKKFCS